MVSIIALALGDLFALKMVTLEVLLSFVVEGRFAMEVFAHTCLRITTVFF